MCITLEIVFRNISYDAQSLKFVCTTHERCKSYLVPEMPIYFICMTISSFSGLQQNSIHSVFFSFYRSNWERFPFEKLAKKVTKYLSGAYKVYFSSSESSSIRFGSGVCLFLVRLVFTLTSTLCG